MILILKYKNVTIVYKITSLLKPNTPNNICSPQYHSNQLSATKSI